MVFAQDMGLREWFFLHVNFRKSELSIGFHFTKFSLIWLRRVNGTALLTVLGKLGCAPQFVRLLQDLHNNMKACLNFNGCLSEPISIENGVKQWDILGPTLFLIFFATMLSHAFRDSYVFEQLEKFLIYVVAWHHHKSSSNWFDDADLVAHAKQDMQSIMDLLSEACTSFRLTISLTKTKVTFTPPSGETYKEPDIFVNGQWLKVDDTYVCLPRQCSR